MESPKKKPELVKLTKYNSSLLLCLFLGVGICCAVLPVLPPTPAFNGSNQLPLSYSISRICLALVIILADVYFYRSINKASALHRSHEVFWPMRCAHCARAVGLQSKSKQRTRNAIIRSTGEENYSNQRRRSADDVILAGRPSPIHSSEAVRAFTRDILRYETLSVHSRSRSYERDDGMKENSMGESSLALNLTPVCRCHYLTAMEDLVADHFDQGDLKEPSHQGPLYKKPHKSIINIFLIFCVISVINVTLQIMGLFICLKENTCPILKFVLVIQLLLDISLAIAIIFGFTFFYMYYDAVFIEGGKYAYHMVIMFSACIWITLVKLVYPLNTIMGFTDNQYDYPCKASGSFGNFLRMDEILLTPFYAECGIIAAGLVWQMWTSMLPRSYVQITEPNFGTFQIAPAVPFWSEIPARSRIFCRKLTLRKSSYPDESEPLLVNTSGRRYALSLPRIATVLSILAGIMFIGLSEFIKHVDYTDLTDATKEYIRMSIEMAFYLPTLLLYRYQRVMCNSFNHFSLQENISILHGLVEGHDRILFLSCVGIFTLNIFRFMGSVGLLFSVNSIPHDQVALAFFTIVYSLFRIYALWQMTSFLCVVQRQLVQSEQGIRWTIICLAYTGVLNGAQWLSDSTSIDLWVELRVFYDDTAGMIIGFLLEPIASLYGIHAAMLALEAYRSVPRETNAN